MDCKGSCFMALLQLSNNSVLCIEAHSIINPNTRGGIKPLSTSNF